MSSGGFRPGAGRKPVPDKRVRLAAYVTPRTMKVLAGMSEDLGKPVGQIIDSIIAAAGSFPCICVLFPERSDSPCRR